MQLFRTIFSAEKVFLCFATVATVATVSFTEREDGGLLSFIAICRFSRCDMPLLFHHLVRIDASVLHCDAPRVDACGQAAEVDIFEAAALRVRRAPL